MDAPAFLAYTAIVALAAAWAVLLLARVGLRDWVVVRAPRLISELAACDFCLSWWLCVIFSLVAAFVVGDFRLLLCALTATPITRFLL
jgi:hypothetical protein